MSRFRAGLIAASLVGAGLAAASLPGAAARPVPFTPRSGWLHLIRPSEAALTASRVAVVPQSRRPNLPHLDASLDGLAAAPVTVTLRGTGLRTAVAAVGGSVTAAADGAIDARVAGDRLAALSQQPGVDAVERPIRPWRQAVSEGVADSNADAWHTAGITGAGVKVGVIDSEFASGTTVQYDLCAGAVGPHGSAVVDIVSQMAPAATIIKACVADSVSFANAVDDLLADGVKIISTSLGFPGDSRGDGSGDGGATVTAVKKARQAGVLVVVSAGNNGADHYGGTLADADHDSYLDLRGTASNQESDTVAVANGGSADFVLQWDQWPSSSLALTLDVTPFTGNTLGTRIRRFHSGTRPVIELCFNPGGTGGCASSTYGAGVDFQGYLVEVRVPDGFSKVRYDLSYWGDTSFNDFSCLTYSGNNCTQLDPRGTSESITAPATSPYALAVGASDARKNSGTAAGQCHSPAPGDTSTYPLEEYSSQGPTIDGRVKPDLTAYDNVSNDHLSPFCGTSAAAPHVAGAAALVLDKNGSMDLSQVQTFLQDRAGVSPPTDRVGYGVLKLGATTGVVPHASLAYTGVSPSIRIVDTRAGLPSSRPAGPMSGTESFTAPVPASIPGSATHLWVHLTGVGAAASTVLSVYGDNGSLQSNIQIDTVERAVTIAALVPIGHASGSRVVRLYNSRASVDAIVDVVGYFSPSVGNQYSSLAAPTRILKTGSSVGGHPARFGNGEEYVLGLGSSIPSTATAVAINLSATPSTGDFGYLAAYANNHGSSPVRGTLNYQHYQRSNFLIVPIGSDGKIRIYNSGPPTDVIVDLVGFFGPSGTQRLVPQEIAVRMIDTDRGIGGYLGNRASNSSVGTHVRQLDGVTDNATAVLATFTVYSASAQGYLTVYPRDPRPPTATLPYTPGRTVVNQSISGLTAGGNLTTYLYQGPARVVSVEFGYFL